MPPRTSFAVSSSVETGSSTSSSSSELPPPSARATGGASAAMLNASVDVDYSPTALPPAIAKVNQLVTVRAAAPTEPARSPSAACRSLAGVRALPTSLRSSRVWARPQDGIKRTYSEKIRPVEQMYGFEAFRDVATDSEFEAKPSVLLIGQYGMPSSPSPTRRCGCRRRRRCRASASHRCCCSRAQVLRG